MNDLIKLYFTIRYLKPIQVVNRFYRKLKRTPKLNISCVNRSKVFQDWLRIEYLPSSYIGHDEFSFLNESSYFTHWNDENKSKLWLYNLHYFDDLNAINAIARQDIHLSLISKWVGDNPIGVGNGWEPYPLSLRITNWIKYFLSFDLSNPKFDKSLYQQTHYLSHNLEYHLLGNHLFENAKALVFSGCYFDSSCSKKWLKKGLKILDKEISEQISEDGSNFELSPMYHNILLAGMLDLYNLASTYQRKELMVRKEYWKQIILKMIRYSLDMNHPDGEVSLFNDSAIGIAAKTRDLISYADRLGIQYRVEENSKDTLVYSHYLDAGYVVVESCKFKAHLDIAKVGPDYLPGHGHADTLSFEASFYGQRVFVNTGTSVYGLSEERLRQRKTAAHNTVEIDGKDSSEVWSGFRVARRAYPSFKHIVQNDDSLTISASHDGYMRLKGKVTHNRDWQFTDSQLVIHDKLTGLVSTASAFLHIHPDVEVKQVDRVIYLTLPNSQMLTLESNSEVLIEPSTWHPEFGKSIPNIKLVFPIKNQLLTVLVKF
ncbi:TPA: alginate lyase family protein [Vibrio parahaemolyticus]|uniref:Heparin-sulfate lyase n=1 Tax=Vibrio parahaemolyticus TaxID=670 RepID=A0A7M1WPA6_VIBPH|nr:heparinase II/III family protein [Vibrio parahaemolyticus]ELN6867944.1 alginate lyase family protein [Vibrio parahaemolyticus]MDI7833598.1 heparinase II/III family protein [Vibrio parahaemolyticus]QOS28518.1 heparin-sulfate lyase [Vibrio parahaemolyticus]HCE2846189.1 alginate lyase family protein [Vibrio parahaemolyticus]HCE2862103.1 alginate lyase family protein [Vibrio parahaemolyticus]